MNHKATKSLKHLIKGIGIKIKEKRFCANGTTIKYLLYMNQKSDVLIVGLQACANPATYNYVRSLRNCNASKLYIKDDFAEDGRGSYYLGEKGKNNVEPATISLIKDVCDSIKTQGG